MAPGEGL